jgi:mono/diheme cytochrome c family protein
MKAARILGFGCAVLGPMLIASLSFAQVPGLRDGPQSVVSDLVNRGEYLTRAGDCIACHTKPGGAPYAGGLAFKLPFGTLYSRNITPDIDTGIGSWSDDDFLNAMQKGVAKGGEHLYPAFPYTAYTKLSRDDILAIKAYIFSLAPVRSVPPENSLAFPFNQRWAMMFWNLLFNPDKRFEPDPAQSPEWNRGNYLVEALEHCGECHTPRRITQNLNNSQKFAGTVTQGWMAYNITSHPQSGIAGWSDAALTSYLTTGHAEGHSSASGPMAEAIVNSLRYLTPADIHAIIVYLRSVAPIETVPAIAQNPPAVSGAIPPTNLGAQVFAGNCANCHDWNGKGAQSPYANLLGSRTVNDPAATNIIAIALSGSKTPLPAEHVFMPPFGRGHSDDELAAVTNFINGHFGNGTANVTVTDIEKARKALP